MYFKQLPKSEECLKRIEEKKAKHIDLIKHLHNELQEQATQVDYLSEELKQANQQLLEVGE